MKVEAKISQLLLFDKNDKSNMNALLFDKWSVMKNGKVQKGKKANNLAPSKNRSVPGGAASHGAVPSRLPPKLGPTTLPLIRISS